VFDSWRCQIFLGSSGSGTGSTQPREQFEELLGINSSGSRSIKSKLRSEGLVALTTLHPLSAKVGTSFADRRRSLDRCSSLSDSRPLIFSCYKVLDLIRSVIFLFFSVYFYVALLERRQNENYICF
jgi:hypothetical protein